MDIFYDNQEFHQTALQTQESGIDIPDISELCDKHERLWAVLADRGYQGREFHVPLLHPTRQPQNCFPKAKHILRNRKISSDEVLIESFFGRLVGFWEFSVSNGDMGRNCMIASCNLP